ncbi:serine hydrolase [Raineya orbicola]|uniref:Beta-lactamase enzyme family n=1 Tax=Raineya orbicola TaxID=2016530 RepID=A0A2N3I321_9BACT|nr:serine hydrolase [Raineya orbicola]PKQ64701.1 Beta-lactamase enzyme family [Raineya orbicola]
MKAVLIFLCLSFTFSYKVLLAQKKSSPNPLELILYTQYDYFQKYLERKEYGIQIIYSQIDRNEENKPALKTFRYNVDIKNYFYPASTIKLPVILLSLEKVNKINQIKEDVIINHFTRMSSVASNLCPEGAIGNLINDPSPPCLAKYIEQILLVSDNPSFARLYDFLGQKYIHTQLAQKGYDSIRIVRRLGSSCYTAEQNKCTNATLFYDSQLRLIYKEPETCNDSTLSPLLNVSLGKAFVDMSGKLQYSPMDFSQNNFLPLQYLHEMTISALLPEAVPPQKRFHLTQEQLTFIRKTMGAYPREGKLTTYRPEQGFFDAYKKYFIYGQNPTAIIKPKIRVFNIVGLAYGFAIDSAYIVDFENNVEFFLTAVIHTNRNEILNDNNYEYTSEAMPFLQLLSETIYKYELARKKKYNPNLSNFNLYD